MIRRPDFIIPAIDIMDGKCVRLTKGDFSRKSIYSEDPVQLATAFESKGITRLHLVDLDGARARKLVNLDTLRSIAKDTSLIIDYGGGVTGIDDVKRILDAGAAKVTLGTIAVKHPEILEEWIMEFGADKFLIGIDVVDEMVKVSGWEEDTQITISEVIRKMMAIGINRIFCTDIMKDGMLSGPSIDLYAKLRTEFPELDLIASGGVTSWNDINALAEVGCSAAIVGKALFEGNFLILE